MAAKKTAPARSVDTRTLKKIDVHTHILPERLPRWKEKFGYGGFIQLEHSTSCDSHAHPPSARATAKMVRDDGTFFRHVEQNCWDPRTRIQECDSHEVRIQVLSTVPTLFHYWAKPQDTNDTSRFLNDHIAEVRHKNPERFVGLGTLPLQDPRLAVTELERCMKDLGLAGVQIGSHVNEWNLDDPHLFPVFEAAEKLGAAIFVHPWDMMGADRMKKYWLPWLVGMPAELAHAISSMIFGGVFEKFPKLRVAFAHGGGAFPGTFGRIQHGFDARPDLCAVDNPHPPKKYLGHFFVDSLVHDPKMLEILLELFGTSRVMLGTDYPFPLGEKNPGELICSLPHLSESVQDQLLFQNALEWLGLNLIGESAK